MVFLGQRIGVFLAVVLPVLSAQVALAGEKVPAEISRALGTNRGKAVSSGLVFIDGKYLRPPYRVSRVGNQIQINDRPVTGQLVPWEKFLETQPPSKVKVIEVADPAGSAAPAAKPDSDDGGAPTAKSVPTAVRRVLVPAFVGAAETDLDDFKPGEVPEKMKLSDVPPDSEADKARQKRAEAEKADESEDESAPATSAAADTAASDDPVDPASPEGEAAAKKAAERQAAAKTRKVGTLVGAFEENARSRKLLKPIDAYRAKLEATLRRGGYLFFGTASKSYVVGRTSEAMAAKELLKKLPELMRDAESSEALCDSTRSAGLMSYITYAIAQDLYRNKTDYYALIQRRRELAEDEKMQRMLKNGR